MLPKDEPVTAPEILAEAPERTLALRLDSATDARLRTMAAVLGYSESATAKIAIQVAAERLMEVVHRVMEETARDYVVRALGLPPDEESRRVTPISNGQLNIVVEKATFLQFDIHQANALLERRRYLKNFGPLRYQGSESDRVTASLLFEPRSDAGQRDALRDARNEAAGILFKEVERFRRRWTNIGGLRRQMLELEWQRSLASPDFIREMQAQAQALSDLIAQVEQGGQITEEILTAVRDQPLFADWVLPLLQRADLDDPQKLAAMREQLLAMPTRIDGLVRLREQDDQRIEALQRSPAWNDANALADMVQQRQSRPPPPDS